MEFTTFIRKPFVVQAIEITEKNINEVAEFIGTVRTKGDLTYIALDRRIVPNVSRAYIGWFLTILGDNYRCYAPKVFNDQFVVQDFQVTSFKFESTEEGTPQEDIEPAVAPERPVLVVLETAAEEASDVG